MAYSTQALENPISINWATKGVGGSSLGLVLQGMGGGRDCGGWKFDVSVKATEEFRIGSIAGEQEGIMERASANEVSLMGEELLSCDKWWLKWQISSVSRSTSAKAAAFKHK